MALGGQLTHVYRAIWVDNSLNVFDVLFDNVHDWLRGRGSPMDIKRDEVVVKDFRTATWSRFENSLGRAEQFNLIEEHEGNWVTSITAIWTPEENVFWADVRTELPQSQVGIVKAPSVVRALLLSGGEPQIGRDSIEVQPKEVDDQNSLDQLIVGLNDEERVIPYLVYRVGRDSERRLSVQRATRASETLAGLAQVFVVDENSIRYLNADLPDSLRIDECGARLFMPESISKTFDAKLTYFVPSSDLGDDQKQLGRMMLRRIGTTSQWPEVPVTWAMLKRECDNVRNELLKEAKEKGLDVDTGAIERPVSTAELDNEVQRLRERVEFLQSEVVTAVIAAEEEAERAEQYINMLVTQLSKNDGPTHFALRKNSMESTISDARTYLHHVEIAPNAARRIEVLDASEMSGIWARDFAYFLIALERFAIAKSSGKFSGDFLKWCQEMGEYSANKIAMNESQPTLNDPELRAKRVFDVPVEVDVTGLKLMVAHAKIQIRGDDRIPRVYFFDDTKGETGKVHIGFIGPHFLVPSSTF
jgi:hypothetical protein